jgi:putative resolvase
MSNLLTVKEAADLLGVSTKTIRRWEADGKIRSVRTTRNHRRFDVSELLGNKSDSSLTVAYARLYGSRSHKNKQIVQQLKEVADQLK